MAELVSVMRFYRFFREGVAPRTGTTTGVECKMPILRHYVMIAQEGQERALTDALVALAAAVRPLDGSEGVDIFQDPDAPTHFVFIEHWTSVEAHKAAGAALGKEALAPVMAALAARPEGRYLEPVST